MMAARSNDRKRDELLLIFLRIYKLFLSRWVRVILKLKMRMKASDADVFDHSSPMATSAVAASPIRIPPYGVRLASGRSPDDTRRQAQFYRIYHTSDRDAESVEHRVSTRIIITQADVPLVPIPSRRDDARYKIRSAIFAVYYESLPARPARELKGRLLDVEAYWIAVLTLMVNDEDMTRKMKDLPPTPSPVIVKHVPASLSPSGDHAIGNTLVVDMGTPHAAHAIWPYFEGDDNRQRLRWYRPDQDPVDRARRTFAEVVVTQ